MPLSRSKKVHNFGIAVPWAATLELPPQHSSYALVPFIQKAFGEVQQAALRWGFLADFMCQLQDGGDQDSDQPGAWDDPTVEGRTLHCEVRRELFALD